MGFFNFFHTTKTYDEDIKREKECLANIKSAVSEKCGLSNFIDYNDFSVAFAGSKDNMELFLVICTQKCDGKKYLYASVDDEVSWQEWDFDNLAEFESHVAEYIINRVNRTIKTVTKKVKHRSYQKSIYYLDEIKIFCKTNGWQARGWYKHTYPDIINDWFELQIATILGWNSNSFRS